MEYHEQPFFYKSFIDDGFGFGIYRQLAEEQWIMKLKTKIPQGCNVKLN